MTTENAPLPSHVSDTIKLALAWLAVGVPLIWGIVQTVKKAMALFA